VSASKSPAREKFLRAAGESNVMVDAVIMVRTDAGQSEETVMTVRELENVTEAHVVAGEFDIIAEVTADEVYDVLQTASSNLQSVDGILDTKTYIAMG
jgi:DNA-binding Lrp family transcriptional regulator